MNAPQPKPLPQPQAVLKVVIDARMVSQTPHGIARYVLELAQGLKALASTAALPYTPIFLIPPQLPQATLALFAPWMTHTTPIPAFHPQESWALAFLLKKLQAALFHSPSFASLLVSPCPTLITLHDLNHLQFGGPLKKLYYQVLVKRFAKRCQRVLTVSHFSRAEIASWLGFQLEQIDVVPNALDYLKDTTAWQLQASHTWPLLQSLPLLQASHATHPHTPLQPHKYFYHLAQTKPHKNLARLLAAYALYHAQSASPWPLVVSHTPQPEQPGVRTLGNIPAQVSEMLMQNAGGYLSPSRYEGMGLAPLEAVALGVPQAVSDIPAHREGLAGIEPPFLHYVAPDDTEAWAAALHKLAQGFLLPPLAKHQALIFARFSRTQLALKMHAHYQNGLMAGIPPASP